MHAKGLLVGYSGYPNLLNYLMPDNGLASLAGALRAAGHTVQILDCSTVEFFKHSATLQVRQCMAAVRRGRRDPSYNGRAALEALEAAIHWGQLAAQDRLAEELIARTERHDLDFIGFKLWEGTGYRGVIRICQRIRQHCPRVLLFAGGPQADLYLRGLGSNGPVFDAIALNDGEETILGLAEHAIGHRSLDDIPNLAYWDRGHLQRTPTRWLADIDRMPFPCYDPDVYLAMQGEDQKLRVITYDESRGCSNGCSFCIHALRSGQRRRCKSATAMSRDFSRLHQQYGFSCFRFAGSSAPVSLWNDLRAGPLPMPDILYAAFLHPADADPQSLRAASENGLHAVFIGLESGSDEMLTRAYGKHHRAETVERTIQDARRLGIYTAVSVIMPGPGETTQTKQDTLELLRRARPDSVLIISPRLYPGTAWYRNPCTFGFRVDAFRDYDTLMEFQPPRVLPGQWGTSLPFLLDDKGFASRMAEAEQFSDQVTALGIPLGISDDAALLACLAGYQGREDAFNRQTRQALVLGDVDWVQGIVHSVNEAVRRKASQTSSLRRACSPCSTKESSDAEQ